MNPGATILLIRHCSTANLDIGLAGSLPGIHLDENGRAHALRLAAKLAETTIDAIYSSPLERALETARPLSARTGLPMQPMDELGELDFGEWQGRDFPGLQGDHTWNLFNRFRSATPAPGGGMMIETQARIARCLVAIAKRHPGQTAAVFSHADTIKAAVFFFLGIPLDFHSRLEISPGSLTNVGIFDEIAVVRFVNVL